LERNIFGSLNQSAVIVEKVIDRRVECTLVLFTKLICWALDARVNVRTCFFVWARDRKVDFFTHATLIISCADFFVTEFWTSRAIPSLMPGCQSLAIVKLANDVLHGLLVGLKALPTKAALQIRVVGNFKTSTCRWYSAVEAFVNAV